MKLLTCVAAVALTTSASIWASPISFPECPAVGNDNTGCEFLITVTSPSTFTVTASSPDLGPYDGSDDTLVGVLNNSGSTITSISISSSVDIFNFDGDGACSGSFGVIPGCAGATDPSGYAPAGVTFSGVNASFTAGTVNFTSGLAPGGSTWFSLEEALSVTQINPGVPEPSSILLLVSGLVAIGVMIRRHRVTSHS